MTLVLSLQRKTAYKQLHWMATPKWRGSQIAISKFFSNLLLRLRDFVFAIGSIPWRKYPLKKRWWVTLASITQKWRSHCIQFSSKIGFSWNISDESEATGLPLHYQPSCVKVWSITHFYYHDSVTFFLESCSQSEELTERAKYAARKRNIINRPKKG